MELGCHLPTQGPVATREALVSFARLAEARQLASLWVSDHVVFPTRGAIHYPGGRFPHSPQTPYLEAVTVLAAAALCTERVRLGSSVLILGHRNPVVMAKMLATIDVLSNGRLICGVGVGWWREEFAALGVPFADRGRRADEMLRLFKVLWTEEAPRFEGEFYRVHDIGFAPKPVQKPHPPLWIGGHSQAALRRAVGLGDGWHASNLSPAELRQHLEQLQRVADIAGRPLAQLTLSLRLRLPPEMVEDSRQALIDRLCAYKALGLSHLVLDFRRDDLAQMLETLDFLATEVAPALQAA
ncbi:MAG: F420-dependent oxidoreductase [Candidatus Tectimicrobiota bacterium]|nr:MAG: F420-dependent oxidoreductase [Candidatus Tectomicrobia bacterium]